MHDIVHELTIAAPPQQVFDAITTVAGLAAWWSDDVSTSGDATVTEGADLTIGLGQDRTVVHLRIDTLDPPLLAHLTCLDGPEEWAGTELAFRVEPDDRGGSVLRFWHGGWEYEDGALPRCSFEWAMDLARLREACESGPVSA